MRARVALLGIAAVVLAAGLSPAGAAPSGDLAVLRIRVPGRVNLSNRRQTGRR